MELQFYKRIFEALFLATAMLATIPAICQPPNFDSLHCAKILEPAKFPGAEWESYFQEKLNKTVPNLKGAPAGTYQVIVLFVIGKDGVIKQVKPSTKFGYGMEEEVMRVIGHSPKWVPAKQNGRNVNEFRRQAATFIVPGTALSS